MHCVPSYAVLGLAGSGFVGTPHCQSPVSDQPTGHAPSKLVKYTSGLTLKVNVSSAKFEGNVISATSMVTLTGPVSACEGVPVSTPLTGSIMSQLSFMPPGTMLHRAPPEPPVLVIVVEYGVPAYTSGSGDVVEM